MDDSNPSFTAYFAALRRAAHQIVDHPRIFDDPLAVRILGRNGEALVRSRTDELQQPSSRALRAYLAVRARYTEDELARAVKRGALQYVILGAGLDTFAYRNPFADAGLQIFEVDRRTTQAWKRACLAEAEIPVPESVCFVPFDFEMPSLVDALSRAGVDFDKLAFFSWLGVTRYLTRKSTLRTLASIARSTPAGSEVVFDFAIPPPLAKRLGRLHARARRFLKRRSGEPLIGYFDPPRLAARLRRIGFQRVETIGPKEMNARYCAGREDGLACDSRHDQLIKARV